MSQLIDPRHTQRSAAGATPIRGYKQTILILDYNYMELDTDVYEEGIPVSTSTVRLGWNMGANSKIDQEKWLPKVTWLRYINTDFEGTFDLKQIVGQGVD